MYRKCIVTIGLLAALPLIGCGEPQPTNTMEGVDQQALADYERMIAEDEQRMSADGDDTAQ